MITLNPVRLGHHKIICRQYNFADESAACDVAVSTYCTLNRDVFAELRDSLVFNI